MRASYQCLLLTLFLFSHPCLASEAKQLFSVVGMIRVGADEDRSLVLIRLKHSQKTLLVACKESIPDTSYQLVGVTRHGVKLRNSLGEEEHLELEVPAEPSLLTQEDSLPIEEPPTKKSITVEVLTLPQHH